MLSRDSGDRAMSASTRPTLTTSRLRLRPWRTDDAEGKYFDLLLQVYRLRPGDVPASRPQAPPSTVSRASSRTSADLTEA
jgi:hypothetical protein